MPRPYSTEFVMKLNKADPSRLGVKLGKLCVEANLPASYVAVALESSRMAVHGWFRGKDIRKSKHGLIEVFMDLVRRDMDQGRLPAKNYIDAKSYIEDMLGIRI